jgi:hypothetical protein
MGLLNTIKTAIADAIQRKHNRDEFNFNHIPSLYYHGIKYLCDYETKATLTLKNCTGNCEKCDYSVAVYGEKREQLEQEESRRNNRGGD